MGSFDSHIGDGMIVSEEVVTVDIEDAGRGSRILTDFAGTDAERYDEGGKLLDCAIPGIVKSCGGCSES
jgi:hypothetical protein